MEQSEKRVINDPFRDCRYLKSMMETIGNYLVVLFGFALILFNKPLGYWGQIGAESILNRKLEDNWYFRGQCIILGLVFVLSWIVAFRL